MKVFVEAGADVGINVLTPNYVTGVAKALALETGRIVVPVVGYMTKAEGAQRATGRVLCRSSRIDVLINTLVDYLRAPLVRLLGDQGEADGISNNNLDFIMDINLIDAPMFTCVAGLHMLATYSNDH